MGNPGEIFYNVRISLSLFTLLDIITGMSHCTIIFQASISYGFPRSIPPRTMTSSRLTSIRRRAFFHPTAQAPLCARLHAPRQIPPQCPFLVHRLLGKHVPLDRQLWCHGVLRSGNLAFASRLLRTRQKPCASCHGVMIRAAKIRSVKGRYRPFFKKSRI